MIFIKIGAINKPNNEAVEASKNKSLDFFDAIKLDLILQKIIYKINRNPMVPCSYSKRE